MRASHEAKAASPVTTAPIRGIVMLWDLTPMMMKIAIAATRRVGIINLSVLLFVLLSGEFITGVVILYAPCRSIFCYLCVIRRLRPLVLFLCPCQGPIPYQKVILV